MVWFWVISCARTSLKHKKDNRMNGSAILFIIICSALRLIYAEWFYFFSNSCSPYSSIEKCPYYSAPDASDNIMQKLPVERHKGMAADNVELSMTV